MKMKLVIIMLILMEQLSAISLGECLSACENEYSLKENLDIITQSAEAYDSALRSSYYPQIYLAGSFRGQSESTEIEFEGLPFQVELPEQPQESWNLAMQMNQVIYDGGSIKRQRSINTFSSNAQSSAIESSILERKLETASLYYGYMICSKQKEILELHKTDLNLELEKVKVTVEAGLLDNSSIYQIEEQQLKLTEEILDLEYQLADLGKKLEILTGLEITDGMQFEPVNDVVGFPDEIHVPELSVLQSRKQIEMEQTKLSGSGLLPQVRMTASAAYGSPGFDMFSENPHGYYQATINLSWKIWDWNIKKMQIKLHQFQAKSCDNEINAVEERLEMKISECDTEITKYAKRLLILEERLKLFERLSKDRERKHIAGTVSSYEYLQQLNRHRSCELERASVRLQKEFSAIKKLLIMGGSL